MEYDLLIRGGRVVLGPFGFESLDRLRIEDSDVSGIAGSKQSSILDPINRRHFESKFIDGPLQAHRPALTRSQTQKRRAVTEIRAKLHVGAGV
jgi:hypothetical protein